MMSPNTVPRIPDLIRYVLQVTIKDPQPMLVPIEKAHMPAGVNDLPRPPLLLLLIPEELSDPVNSIITAFHSFQF